MRATTILKALSTCLCDTIEKSQVPDVCFCGIVPGDGVVADYADGCSGGQGIAWVRQTELYPAAGLNRINEEPNNCQVGFGMDIEMGMLRPMAVLDARGNPPTPEQYEQSAALANDDALVMLKALQCCDLLSDIDYTLGTYTPAGPLGGLVGGTWSLAVMLD